MYCIAGYFRKVSTIASYSYTFNFNEFIFVEVTFFEISKNKNPSKITRYTVLKLVGANNIQFKVGFEE